MSDFSPYKDLAEVSLGGLLAEYASSYGDYDEEPTEAERSEAVEEFLADAGRFPGVGDSWTAPGEPRSTPTTPARRLRDAGPPVVSQRASRCRGCGQARRGRGVGHLAGHEALRRYRTRSD